MPQTAHLHRIGAILFGYNGPSIAYNFGSFGPIMVWTEYCLAFETAFCQLSMYVLQGFYEHPMAKP